MTTIGTSDFVKRQTPESTFTHFDGTWSELEKLVDAYFYNHISGYKPGVVLIDVPAENFYMHGPLKIGSKLEAKFEPRAAGEDPVLQIINHDPKIVCNFVDIVLYRHDVLAEDDNRSTDATWEIVSINGKESNEPEPMKPVTMARNQLHLTGGTKANYTPEEFAKAIMYWNKRK